MIVANTQVKVRQTRIKIDIQKPTILQLLSKNQKENKKSYETKISPYLEDNYFSKYHIIITQKQTKTTLFSHKLHSSHPFT